VLIYSQNANSVKIKYETSRTGKNQSPKSLLKKASTFAAMRYFMDLSYRGTAFHGWQIQPNAHTVQAEMQQALSTILQEGTEIVGSGRTDTGVHASQQIVHFDATKEQDLEKLQFRLNGLLPDTISVNKIVPVYPTAHARFDAVSRTYHYHIHTRKNPFREGLSYYYSRPLNIDKIEDALEVIKSWKNFQAFSKVHTEVVHFDCDILDATWKETNDGHMFSVSANRFLRGMVRATMGTLLEIGLERISIEDLKAILESGDRSEAGRAVPPQGLYLSSVRYPKSIYIDI